MTEVDEQHLRRAIELAAEARAAGDMPFGSLLVGPDGDVLAEDRNTVVTERDITAHPELKLARRAARQLEADIARQTTMYTSCQPCPMCTVRSRAPDSAASSSRSPANSCRSSSRPQPSAPTRRTSPTKAARCSPR
jgi:pyrimidine deaminase RibD-like protein